MIFPSPPAWTGRPWPDPPEGAESSRGRPCASFGRHDQEASAGNASHRVFLARKVPGLGPARKGGCKAVQDIRFQL